MNPTSLDSLHFTSFTTRTLCDTVFFKFFQGREGESDPLLNMEKGSVVTETVGQMSPVWSKDKD